MSAAGRNLPGAERRADDFYATPPWCVEALLRCYHPPSGLWLEPTAGSGAIASEVLRLRDDVRWHLVERRAEETGALRALGETYTADYLGWSSPATYAVALGNPPFSYALEVVQHALTMSRVVVMLLRINFLASQKRAEWMRVNTPSIYVLPRRPSFTNKGTDATEYAWFAWDGSPARVVIL